jgi:hypothetical protein
VHFQETMIDSPKGRPMSDPMKGVPAKVDAIEQTLDALAGSGQSQFASVDARFEAVDARFDEVDARFDEVASALREQRQYTEFAFDRLRSEMSAGFGRLERKLDALIDRVLGGSAGA